jgi:hypothetical protein
LVMDAPADTNLAGVETRAAVGAVRLVAGDRVPAAPLLK